MSLIENPVSEQDGYVEKVFAMFPQLEVLDGLDKEGNEVLSEEDEDEEYDEEYGEEGEDYSNLDPEIRKKLQEQYPNGLPEEEEEFDDYDDEEGEEYDEEEGDEEENGGLGKRQRGEESDDEEDEDAAPAQTKRKK